MTGPTPVVIADEQEAVRRGLRRTLTAGGFDVTAEAANGAEVLRAVRGAPCRVLLLHLRMPDGLDVLEIVTRAHPDVAVLVMSVPEDRQVRQALDLGAAGCIRRDALAEDLIPAIRQVCAGGRYVPARLTEALALPAAPLESRPALDRLSNRERQVLCMIARGLRVRDIAAELQLSDKTVSTYRTRVLEKLALTTTAQLIRYALREKLVD